MQIAVVVLFAFWAEAIDFDNLFANPWSDRFPLTTPDGLADPAGAVAALGLLPLRLKLPMVRWT